MKRSEKKGGRYELKLQWNPDMYVGVVTLIGEIE